MAIPKAEERVVDSFTIQRTNQTAREQSGEAPYVAKLMKIEALQKSYNVEVQRYYRPEEAKGGLRQFHGSKELFLSDQIYVQRACTILGKCTVHSLKSYCKLETVGPDDYFSRFQYKAQTGDLNPDCVAVYCKCEMPYNPDNFMVQCIRCLDWFHPACVVGKTMAHTQLMHPFLCTDSCGAQMEPPSKRLKKA